MTSQIQTFSFLMACFITLSTVATADSSSLKSLDQMPAPQIQDSELMLLTICWDGQTFIDECQKHRTLIQQLLYKLLLKIKTPGHVSDSDALVEEDRIPLKRRREDPSGFYSNW